MEVGGLAFMVLGKEKVSRDILHQGPHCPFVAETESNQTWSFYTLTTGSGWAGLASTARARARTRSGAT